MESHQDLILHKRLLRPNFLYYQQLIENVVFTVTDSTVARSAILDYYRQYFSHYKTHLTAINKYAKTYRSIQAACWYTKDTFIHRIINKVLRTGNIKQCSLLRFYITDLSEQLYQLKCEQQKNIVESEPNIVLYRGLRQSEMHLETLRNLVVHVILTKGCSVLCRSLPFTKSSITTVTY